MKLLVCGGRYFGWTKEEQWCIYTAVYDLLSSSSPNPKDHLIISGEAIGTDTVAKYYAQIHFTDYKGYPAKWNEHGRKAGPIRNGLMLAMHPDVDLVMGFVGGRGTDDMLEKATRAKIKTQQITWHVPYERLEQLRKGYEKEWYRWAADRNL